MEYCIEARALKPSLRREIDVFKGYSQSAAAITAASKVSVVDEIETNCGGFVDDFFIDDLLDFPEKENELEKEKEEEEEKYSVSEDSVEFEIDENGNSTVSEQFDAGLAVPQDDLAELEWVSRIVDDTMPEFPQLYPARKDHSSELSRKPSGAGSFPVQLKQSYHVMVPAKPRTKRQRLGRLWSVGSSTGSESSTTTSSTLSSSSIISTPVQFGYNKPVMKKQRIEPKRIPVQLGGELGVRKCSHCGVQKTPQWRAGPEGAKTLCNACGVRFKSGRLYPEYRPACSPTFREEVHSNSHRKVLEIRKRKEC